MDKRYQHDTESYVITIRRKGALSVAPAAEALKHVRPVHKIEKPSDEAAVKPVPVPMVSADVSSVGKAMISPLPGVIIDIRVKVGDKVKTGDVVAVLEAMKMENEIQSEYDGTVTSVNVSQGDSILEGALIVSLSS